MNMQIAISAPGDGLPWAAAAAGVNAWRGECLQSFARAEAAVTETLLSLSDAGERGRGVRLRHLIGQRLEDLAQAVGAQGGFADEGGAASEALSAFRVVEHLRTHLAHDVARIALARNGSWVVVFRHVSIRGRAVQRGTSAFEEAEAAAALSDLKGRVQRLEAALGNLRRAVATR